jgi:TonB family protein
MNWTSSSKKHGKVKRNELRDSCLHQNHTVADGCRSVLGCDGSRLRIPPACRLGRGVGGRVTVAHHVDVLPVTTLEILPEKPTQLVVRPLAVSVPEVATSSLDPGSTERSAAANPSNRSGDWTRWITSFWAAGACIALLQLLAAFRHLKRLKAASQPADGSWAVLVNDLRQTLSISKQANVRIGANPGPLTFGALRKTILLPATVNEWSVDRRRLVLAHELAHVKRDDGLGQLLCQVVCTVYWFNPLIWYAVRQLGIERERACDDYVLVGLGGSAPDYADHLLQIARGLNGGFVRLAASMAHPSQLKLRVLSILDPRIRRRQMTRFTMAVLLSLTAVVTLGLGSIQVARLSAMPLPAVFLPLHLPVPVAPPSQTVVRPAQTVRQEPGFVVDRLPITYPTEAKQKRIEGTVIVELNFNSNGEIVDSRVLSGPEELRQAAIQTALYNNYAIGSARSLQVMVDFKIASAGTGEISGNTTTPSRGPLPGVTVTATNTETGIGVVSVTNEVGAYRFSGLRPGTYRLTARLNGFQDQSYNPPIGDSQQVRLNFSMQAGGTGGSRVWSIPSISPISLPDQFPDGMVQNLVLIGLPQPALAEMSDKLQNVKGQKMTTALLAQVRASIKETSWGDKPAGFVVSSRTDGTVDLLIKFSARAEAIVVEVLSNGVVNNAGKRTPALDDAQPSPGQVRFAGNLIQEVRPVYPEQAKDSKIQGVVVLEVDVAANGRVSDASVVTGHPVLIPPALDAVRQWVYKPTLLAGQPVEAVSTVTFNFALLQ